MDVNKLSGWRSACRCAAPVLVLVLVSPAGAAGDADPRTRPIAIVGANVVHPERPESTALARNQTIVIEGNRIAAVGPAGETPVPPDARTIHGAGQWVIPGLIDAHVHFFQSGNLYTRPDVADFTRWRPYAQEVARNRKRLPVTFRVWLASGVTGVVDAGGPFWNFDVRRSARELRAAPRVAVAGPLISMVERPILDLGDPPIVRVASPAQARQLVQRELEHEPDYVKVWFIHRPDDDLGSQTAIVRATGAAAHSAGAALAVHATELRVAREALRAGADFLVHSVFDEPVDGEFIDLMRATGALYCPTLFVTNGYAYALGNQWRPTAEERRLADPQVLRAMNDLDRIPRELIPARVRERMEDSSPPDLPAVAMYNLRRLWAAGVPIVMGTDAGNIGTLHGPSIFREMEYMQAAGLTPLEVLNTATTNGARALRMEGELGAVAPGMLADLVVLDRNPLADVKNLASANRVFKDGFEFDPKALMQSIDASTAP